jgi:TRAP-type C4-dicarboxylate transport system substrate-binding protein
MRRLAIPALLLCSAALLVLPGEGQTGDAEFTINFGTVAPDGTPWATQLKDIKTRIQDESGGRIKVRIFLGGTLGGEVEMVQDIVEGGRLQGGGFSSAAVAEGANVPELQLAELPYLFRTDAEVDYILDNVLYEPIKKKLRRRGLHLNMWAINGWRSFYTSNKSIHTLEDLREQKMRVQEAKVHKKMYEAFGVQAEPIAVPDVLDALNRGAVDGFDNTTLFGQASGWFEPTKYYTLSKHIFQPAVILYSRDFFDALPEDLQKIVEGDWRAEQEKGRKGVRDLEDELFVTYVAATTKIYTPTEAELAPFIEAAQTVHTAMRDEVGGELLDLVNSELAAFRAKN